MDRHDDNMLAVLYGEEGRGLEDLARAFGCSPSTVRYRLLSGGVRMRGRGRPRRTLRPVAPGGEDAPC